MRVPSDGDDGRPDARLVAALAAWRDAPGPAARATALSAASGARVFLALAARDTGRALSPTSGLVQERGAEMALLTVVRADGARAMPAFSDGHAVQRWRPEARPVPVPMAQACATALADGAAALLLDPGAVSMALDRAELEALADGRVPVPGSALSTRHAAVTLSTPDGPADPGLLAALAAALRDEPVHAARLLRGPDGPVLGVVPRRALDPAGVAALAARVASRLGERLPEAGLDLAVVPPDGPGPAVPLRRRRWRRRWRR